MRYVYSSSWIYYSMLPDRKVLMCEMILATLSGTFSQVVWNMNIFTVSEYVLSCHT